MNPLSLMSTAPATLEPRPALSLGTEPARGPSVESAELLHELVAAQARVRPDATAVGMGEESITYGELDDATNRLARRLRYSGCEPGDRVAFLLHKSIDAVVTIVATLKAGCPYVPLDPDCPAWRTAKTVRSADPAIVVANTGTLASLKALGSELRDGPPLPVAWMDDDRPRLEGIEVAFARRDVDAEPASELPCDRNGDDPAYIFFTSGSTGAPKGVVITHRNVLSFVRWGVDTLDMGPEDRNSGHAPLHFDLSTFDLFGSFAAGASVHLVPPETNLHPRRLADWIRRTAVTQWFSVPSVLTYMEHFGVVKERDFPSLKRLLWCGEVLPTPTLIHWMERVPHASFTNLYGPTEATVASSYHTVRTIPASGADPLPIGTPCGGESLLVLDDGLEPVPRSVVGNLYIEGTGLSPGYWRDAEQTESAFLTVSGPVGPRRIYRTGDLARVGDDGLVYFVGRNDTQVKCRGHRIELGEIEAALCSLDAVREAAVVALHEGGFEGTVLACAVVPAHDEAAEPAQLRRDLSQLVPPYMLPSRWRVENELPRNRNGKVDRRRIQEDFAGPKEKNP